jgi:hypothetical protein
VIDKYLSQQLQGGLLIELVNRQIVILIILCLGIFYNPLAPGQELSEAEQKIWEMEKKYWEFWLKGDIDIYMTIVHDDFNFKLI